MSTLEVFARALLPITGRTGLVFLQEAARAVVTTLGADACLFVQRVTLPEPSDAFRPIVAFARDELVEATLGSPAELSVIEARCRSHAPSPSSLVWHVVPAPPDSAVCVLARELDDVLLTALALIAARGPSEMARSTSDARSRVIRHLGIVSGASGDLVWEWDLATDRVEWSFESLAGGVVTFDEWRERMHPADRARVLAVLAELRDGKRDRWADVYRYVLRDGSSRIGQVRAIAERGANGEPVRVIGSLHDVTESRAQEQQLILAERMAAMGTLAAGVAHEINNPLAYVKGNVEHVLEQLRGTKEIDPDVVSALEEAREGADRVRRIVQDLRLFARPLDETALPVDVDRVVEAALTFVADELSRCARLEKVLGNPPPVSANETRLGHVVLTLLVNAIQAFPDGSPHTNVLHVETCVDDLGRVLITVRDSGPGIPGEILGRIFDPFFTTKTVGTGTGLGLSIAHSIVSSLGGEIAVESASGVGTTCRVTLPSHR